MIHPPFLPYASSLLSSTANSDPRNSFSLWFGIILSRLLGAIFSGFSSSITVDKTKMIPSTLARLSMAVVAALAISLLLVSGILTTPNPNYEMMLAITFDITIK
jgi:hypothetical protein